MDRPVQLVQLGSDGCEHHGHGDVRAIPCGQKGGIQGRAVGVTARQVEAPQ